MNLPQKIFSEKKSTKINRTAIKVSERRLNLGGLAAPPPPGPGSTPKKLDRGVRTVDSATYHTTPSETCIKAAHTGPVVFVKYISVYRTRSI